MYISHIRSAQVDWTNGWIDSSIDRPVRPSVDGCEGVRVRAPMRASGVHK